MMLWLTLLAGVASAQLVPKKFLPLPLGSIRPAGWLSDQLQVQVNGLAGHEHEFYQYVSQTTWLGGNSTYSDLEEGGSYWFNGIVPTGVLGNSSVLQEKANDFLNYVLDHQDESGWLGPEVGFNETERPRYLWGRYPFMLGTIQMMEAFPDVTDKTLTGLYKFISLANSMIKAGNGLEQWTEARWFEFAITLQWLYDNHPNGQEALLLDTMQQLKSTGVDWVSVFLPQYFPQGPTKNLANPFNNDLTWHGVNVAEALKAGAVSYRFTGNQSDLDSASQGWDLLFQYHGRPSGIFGADEYLAGMEAARGSELCMVVELMFSGSYLYQVMGDLKFADKVEKVAYNALPATLTGNMWSRQYLQQQNQVAAMNMNPDPFPRDGSYSNVFGLEPNYPCCTVNHPQGWPKFISNAFLTTQDGTSLVNLYLGPFSTTTQLAGGNQVTVSVDTIYPFADTLTTTINAAKPFTYSVRVPSWTSLGQATLSVNGGTAQSLNPDENGLQAIQVGAGTTTLEMFVPSDITIESRLENAVAVHRGPFTYAYDIPRTTTVLATNAQQSNAVDLQFTPTNASAWQYAIDPSTIIFNPGPANFSNEILPSPVFDSGLPLLSMTVEACLVDWPLAGDTFASSPPQNVACTGQRSNITLTPFGATKIRIGEFPVIGNS